MLRLKGISHLWLCPEWKGVKDKDRRGRDSRSEGKRDRRGIKDASTGGHNLHIHCNCNRCTPKNTVYSLNLCTAGIPCRSAHQQPFRFMLRYVLYVYYIKTITTDLYSRFWYTVYCFSLWRSQSMKKPIYEEANLVFCIIIQMSSEKQNGKHVSNVCRIASLPNMLSFSVHWFYRSVLLHIQ